MARWSIAQATSSGLLARARAAANGLGAGTPEVTVPVLRVANLAVRALLLMLVGAFVFSSPSPGAALRALEIAAFVVAAALLVLWVPVDRTVPVRQRYASVLPGALATIALLCGAASAVPPGNLFILLGFTAALSAGRDTSLAVGCLVLGVGIAGTESVGLPLGATTAVTVEYPIVLLLGLILGRNLQVHRLQAEQSENLREKQATLAMLDERTRIAREIHDVLAHSLGALAIQIQLARAVLTDSHDQTRAVAVLDRAQRIAADGLSETRRAVHALRGEIPSLAEGIAQLSVDHQRNCGTPVTFEVSGEPYPQAPDNSLAITRVAQEALVNAAKHAPNQRVDIRLDHEPAATTLTVINRLDHDPSDADNPRLATIDAGYGLAGMRERLLLLGGTLSAGPQSDDWVVIASVPR